MRAERAGVRAVRGEGQPVSRQTTELETQRRQQSAPASPAANTWRPRAMLALAVLGTAIAGYLTWVHYSGQLALCTGAGGCETVQASRYSAVAGVPVALLGLLAYLGLLGVTIWRVYAGLATPIGVMLALFGLALAGVLYSGYLTYLELFVIHAICPWCASSAAIMAAIFVLACWELSQW